MFLRYLEKLKSTYLKDFKISQSVPRYLDIFRDIFESGINFKIAFHTDRPKRNLKF